MELQSQMMRYCAYAHITNLPCQAPQSESTQIYCKHNI